MRILMTSYELPPVGGGGGLFAARLSRELANRGHHVDLVTMGFRGLASSERKENQCIIRVFGFRQDLRSCRVIDAVTYVLGALPVIAKLARRNRYNIVHSHFIFPDGLLGLWALSKTRVPFIMTAHGSDVPHHNPKRVRGLHFCLRPLWRLLTRRAAVVVCPSQYLNKLVLKNNRCVKTKIIPNGFNPQDLNPRGDKKRRILVVARMIESKGIQFFLQALVGLQLDYEIVLVGDGPYIKVLKNRARELEMAIRFTGWIDNASLELKYLYETSRIFVLPSETENCPLVLLEAMAAGLAIITTQDTGCAELIGSSGMLVAPRNAQAIRYALMDLVNHPELIKRLGNAARSRLESLYSWQVISQSYQELYDRYAQKS